ncbi:unnamed protein product [Leptidea sinapis]|uniref:5'-Nucleotidase C-terminal domain-containing protein n=1 Tax=Leptidea sinapis TaxID=189913 RepID=A0A5E4QCR3_9NEOP|nr:unnamed protein product [Leptidea sinapis]
MNLFTDNAERKQKFKFEETSDDELICKHGTSCFGGLPRMVYEIEALQRENPDSLLLEAGDSFQGTYWYTALKWNVTQYFLNLLNHDAHAIGNHEFDDDVQGLVPYLASLRAPTVAANLDSTYEPSLQGLYKPYVIVERNGRKIGIVGVTTTVTEVIVVQADAFTKVLGNLSLYFDDEGDVQLWQGGEILLDQSIPEDLSVKKKMAPFVRRVHAAAAKPIGYITTPMNHKDCLYGECLMGNFLADVLRHYGKTNVESPYHFIALIQRSNMRAAVPAGAMTEGEIVELFPYFDPVESFELQGKYILEALERSVSDLMQANIFMAPWLLQVSGLQVIYNISKPEGSRVDKVFVVEGSFHVPLEAEQTYQIVATSYLTYGGDGYATIGNHEFDDGIAGLAPYLAALHAPVVVANIDTSKEPSLSGLYTPHVILERRGRKIGVIGLITTETQTSSNPGRVKFLDPIKTVKMEAQLLTDRGIDIIIVLSHCGLEVDNLLWNGKSPSNEYISGPYPVVIESEAKPGHKIPIVTASAFSKYVGNLTMYFDRAGDLKYFGGKPVFLNRSIPEVVNEEVGYTNEGLIAERCGQQECAIGDLIADAFLNKERELIDGNLTSIAFLLRNMIRGSIPKGGITRGELLNTLPFTNSVVTFLISGRYLIDTFKICMTNFWQRNPFSGPWMPQIAGFKLKINLTEEVDVNVFVKEGDEYQLMNPDKEYRLLLQHGRDFKIIGKDIEIVEEYVRKISPITPTLDNRLVVINTKSKNSTYQ